MRKGKYTINKNEAESEILPNKFGLKTKNEINQSELEGFLHSYKVLFSELNTQTRFNLEYILRLHLIALGHLYSFAGKWRTVNISKGGFMFPPAKFLEQTMIQFEDEMLNHIPEIYSSEDELVKWVARIHAEFLFIHPFREGNGRSARLLANLMCAKAGHELLDFDKLSSKKFNAYVDAVKAAAKKDYTKMETIISSLF